MNFRGLDDAIRFFNLDERLAKISQSGDPLEAVAHDFKIFRRALERTVPKADDVLFSRFDAALHEQRNNEEEKEAIKSGKTADLAQQS